MPLRGLQPNAFEASLPQSLAALVMQGSGEDPEVIESIASAGRSIGGPVVVAFSDVVAARLREDYREGRFRFFFHIIVHGDPPADVLDRASVLSLRHLRSTESTVGTLTSLEVELSSDDKGIRRIFYDAGFPVLGNGALTKASKTASHGTFMSCIRLAFPDPMVSRVSGILVDLSFDLPSKFAAILARERHCYEEKATRLVAADKLRSQMRTSFRALCQERNLSHGMGLEIDDAGNKGFAAFYGWPFLVSAAVISPRASSELLVHTALKKFKLSVKSLSCKSVRVLDLGVGSGALLLSTMLLLEASDHSLDVTGVGVDISLDALAVARCNAAAHGLSGKTCFVQGDFCDIVSSLDASDVSSGSGGFDIVLCNPPYLTQSECDQEPGVVQGPDVALLSRDIKDERLRPWQRKAMAGYEALAIGIGACYASLIRWEGHVVVELGGKRDCAGVQLLFKSHSNLELDEALQDQQGFTRCLVFRSPDQL